MKVIKLTGFISSDKFTPEQIAYHQKTVGRLITKCGFHTIVIATPERPTEYTGYVSFYRNNFTYELVDLELEHSYKHHLDKGIRNHLLNGNQLTIPEGFVPIIPEAKTSWLKNLFK